MDINLARTFLTVAETGSFIDAAHRLNITQSTVSARIKGLEDLLGRPVFERSKSGADLTEAGEQFHKHALTLVRVWQRAQLEVGLSDQNRNHISLGAPPALWNGFLLQSISLLRKDHSDIAITGASGLPEHLLKQLIEGELDLVIMYRPIQPPGHAIEHLFDEEFVLVSAVTSGQTQENNSYVFINWGTDFRADHASAYPDLVNPRLSLDFETLDIDYILSNNLSAYFPLRLVKPYISSGLLYQPENARRFTYPVYVVYPESGNEEGYLPILNMLKRECAKF